MCPWLLLTKNKRASDQAHVLLNNTTQSWGTSQRGGHTLSHLAPSCIGEIYRNMATCKTTSRLGEFTTKKPQPKRHSQAIRPPPPSPSPCPCPCRLQLPVSSRSSWNHQGGHTRTHLDSGLQKPLGLRVGKNQNGYVAHTKWNAQNEILIHQGSLFWKNAVLLPLMGVS